MVKYIIHIGYSKTGTTAIQRFLTNNRQDLKQRGVLYPDVWKNNSWINIPDHNALARLLSGRTGWINLKLSDYFEQFEEQRVQSNSSTIILSGETFLGGIEPWSYKNKDEYLIASANAVKQLGSHLEKHEVEIIVYLRRQDYWLEAILNQNIKFQALLPPPLHENSIEHTIELYKPRLDYASCLEPWASEFGDSAINLGIYEKAQLYNEDIISDFSKKTGIDFSGMPEPTWSKGNKNVRFDRNMIEMKKIFNLLPRPKYEERALVEALHLISNQIEFSEFSDCALFNINQRRKILSDSENSNAIVADRYLNNANSSLFTEPWPTINNTEKEYPGLPVEYALEVLLRLDKYQSTFYGKSRLFRHWSAQQLRQKAPALHSIARTVRKMAMNNILRNF